MTILCGGFIDLLREQIYFCLVGNPSSEEEKGYWHVDPLALVAGRLAYEDRGKEMTTWSHADFMTRKFADAPKDGAFDEVPLTGLAAMRNRFLKILRRKR